MKSIRKEKDGFRIPKDWVFHPWLACLCSSFHYNRVVWWYQPHAATPVALTCPPFMAKAQFMSCYVVSSQRMVCNKQSTQDCLPFIYFVNHTSNKIHSFAQNIFYHYIYRYNIMIQKKIRTCTRSFLEADIYLSMSFKFGFWRVQPSWILNALLNHWYIVISNFYFKIVVQCFIL